jgi:hypothetical protein
MLKNINCIDNNNFTQPYIAFNKKLFDRKNHIKNLNDIIVLPMGLDNPKINSFNNKNIYIRKEYRYTTFSLNFSTSENEIITTENMNLFLNQSLNYVEKNKMPWVGKVYTTHTNPNLNGLHFPINPEFINNNQQLLRFYKFIDSIPVLKDAGNIDLYSNSQTTNYNLTFLENMSFNFHNLTELAFYKLDTNTYFIPYILINNLNKKTNIIFDFPFSKTDIVDKTQNILNLLIWFMRNYLLR